MQKRVDAYIPSLREPLQVYGFSEIMEMKNGILRIRPDAISCDAYLFHAGDSEAKNPAGMNT